MVTTHNDLDYDEIVQKLVQMADAFDRDFCQAGPVLRFEMEAHFRYLLCLAEASLARPFFHRLYHRWCCSPGVITTVCLVAATFILVVISRSRGGGE
uniref:BCL2 like 1 n=1 Tax=Mesocestoides corti TaxID=53468 RepID=A0A5K3FLX2_MESCO